MNIRIEPHTLQRANERGASESEIIDTLETGFVIPAKTGRLGRGKIYTLNAARNSKFYKEKKVEVYYVLENENIITVTVYVFYGQFTELPL